MDVPLCDLALKQDASLFRWLGLALLSVLIAGCVPRSQRPTPQLPN